MMNDCRIESLNVRRESTIWQHQIEYENKRAGTQIVPTILSFIDQPFIWVYYKIELKSTKNSD